MAVPLHLLPVTCDIYRPFGSASPVASNVPCRLVPDLRGDAALTDRAWTHVLFVQPDVDLRDGVTRTDGVDQLVYADGDEIRVPSGATTPRYVVVWVENVEPGTVGAFRRAYLLRHQR